MLRFFKKVEKKKKIFIPKAVVNAMGKEYYLEVYDDKILLVPIKDRKDK